jgi:hypothetical protein
MPDGHKCPVEGCETNVKREYLMCTLHWWRVSTRTQREVFKTFRAWGAGDSVGPYLEARDKAIAEASR